MTRSIFSSVLVCGLIFGAFAAASASAEAPAYKCTSGGSQFKDEHCREASASGPYGAELLPESETAITVTNAQTAEGTSAAAVSKLLGTLSGVITEIQCTGLSGEGSLTNAAKSATGTFTLNSSGCSVTKPSGKGCVINGNELVTNLLKATTGGQTANKLKLTSNSGEALTSITLEKCSIGALNNTYPVTGSFIADTNGATITTTHAGLTSQATLKLGGVKMGMEGALTLEAGEDGISFGVEEEEEGCL
ncbi:MAG: hypothetical protein AB7V58_07935 [Solirubrobacterales bacterium]